MAKSPSAPARITSKWMGYQWERMEPIFTAAAERAEATNDAALAAMCAYALSGDQHYQLLVLIECASKAERGNEARPGSDGG